jgi:2'-5' RNA ligase
MNNDDVRNEDWIRTTTWDVRLPSGQVAETVDEVATVLNIDVKAAARKILTLPSGEAAPPDLRAEALDVLAGDTPAGPVPVPGQSRLVKAYAEAMETKAEGGIDKNRGGAEKLRRYWTHGEGAAKIQWGVPGDFKRCVALLSKYMGTRAKGYCQLRHHDALGVYAGQEHGKKALPFVDARGLIEFKSLAEPVEVKAGAANPDGVMVAFYAPADVAQALAGEDRTPPSDLHMTLAYLGKAKDVPDAERLAAVVEKFAAGARPVDGTVSGTGRFAGDPAEGDPFYASVDSPDLPGIRQRLHQHLTDHGFTPRNDHGFTPHMTLGYLPADAATPTDRPNMPVSFDTMSVAHGPDVWDFPMQSTDGVSG